MGGLFKEINEPHAAGAFRAWARTNYQTGTDISGIWHPIVQAECIRMNMEAAGYKGRWPVVSMPDTSSKSDQAKAALDVLTDTERHDLIRQYCHGCGSPHICYCTRDD